MVILTLLHPQTSKPLKQWRFQRETVIRIGRAPENHVILNHAIVSRFHLELRQVALPESQSSELKASETETRSFAAGWQLVNLSTNGTFVEGEAVDRKHLDAKTQIQLAQDGPTLQFHLEPRSSAAAATLGQNTSPSSTISLNSAPNSSANRAAIVKPTRCTHAGNPPENLFCIRCGQPVRVEKLVRQYQVLRVLGRGGMGTTYLVWNPESIAKPLGAASGRLQVLKEMNADIAAIPKAQELFCREASTLKTLSHPGIPKYYDFFIEADRKYLVMELVHGQDLEKLVRRQGAVTPIQAIEWMMQVCEILEYLHTRSPAIIHRDIKPGNLLIRNLDNRVVVLDFGAVKAAGMAPGTRIGAEGYSAPEQVQGRPVTQSDLYAIGPSLIYLLTGMSPLRFQKRGEPFNRLNLDQVKPIPACLRLVILRVTAAEASDRYQTANELIQALRECLQQL